MDIEIVQEIQEVKDELKDVHPFISYVEEDKSKYKTAREAGYIDTDDDFLIGDSGGLLMRLGEWTFVNTHLLTEVADHYRKHKVYVDAEIDSPAYENFRLREEHRREHGFTAKCKKLRDGRIVDLRITGDHYNFINYGRIKLVDVASLNNEDVDEEKPLSRNRSAKKREDTPKPFDAQYWKFKVDEFAKNNGKNDVSGKARRKGFSYMEGISSANKLNLMPKVVIIHAAYDKKYIVVGEKTLSYMTVDQLKWYEEKTPFNRCGLKDGSSVGFIRKDPEDLLLGYKEGGFDKGILSNLLSVSFGPNNPDAAIGKDAYEIKIEELSNAPNFDAFMEVTIPATTAGDYITGRIKGWGTAGSKEGNWIQFERWFNNPGLYDALEFENVWDKDSRHKTCGWFCPYIWSLEGKYESTMCMDKDGNSNLRASLKLSERTRKRYWEKHKDKSKYLSHCAQYANSPSEAFSASIDNMFSSDTLNQHIIKVKTDTNYKFYRDGMIYRRGDKGQLEFISNEKALILNKTLDLENQYKVHRYIEEYPLTDVKDIWGCIREWYPPHRVNGVIPEGLYRIVLDPFAINKDKKDLKKRDSLASIRVKMNNNTLIPKLSNVCVAAYAGRPESTEIVSILGMLMSEYYGNAKILAEVDRGTVVSDFKKHKKLNLLAKEPVLVWDSKADVNTANYGIVLGNSEKKLDRLGYVQEDLYEVVGVDENGSPIIMLQYELDLPYLLELQKFDFGRNADRISAEIVDKYYKKNLSLMNHKAKTDNKNKNRTTIFDNMTGWYGNKGLIKKVNF